MNILERKHYPIPGYDAILVACPDSTCDQKASILVPSGTEQVSDYLYCSKCGAPFSGQR